MRTAMLFLLAITLLAVLTSAVMLMRIMFSDKARKDWRVYLVFGVSNAWFAAFKTFALLVFRQSGGWTDGVWIVFFIFLSVVSFKQMKKLRASQRQVEAKSKE